MLEKSLPTIIHNTLLFPVMPSFYLRLMGLFNYSYFWYASIYPPVTVLEIQKLDPILP